MHCPPTVLLSFCLSVCELTTVSSADRSLSAGWIGLVGRRGPRSKQPFMVTFFRESQVPCRPPRAVKPHPRRKKPKYDLPVPSIHSKVPGAHSFCIFTSLWNLKCGNQFVIQGFYVKSYYVCDWPENTDVLKRINHESLKYRNCPKLRMCFCFRSESGQQRGSAV